MNKKELIRQFKTLGIFVEDNKVKKSDIAKIISKTIDDEDYANEFLKSYEDTKKELLGEIKRWDRYVPEIQKSLSSIIKFSTTKYNEGEDYYGTDYLSQKLPQKTKRFLSEFLQSEGFVDNVWDFENKLKDLDQALKRLVQDLED